MLVPPRRPSTQTSSLEEVEGDAHRTITGNDTANKSGLRRASDKICELGSCDAC